MVTLDDELHRVVKLTGTPQQRRPEESPVREAAAVADAQSFGAAYAFLIAFTT